MSRIAKMNREFDKWYKKMEEKGEVDYFGGSEYENRKKDWIAKGRNRIGWGSASKLNAEFDAWWSHAEKVVGMLGSKEHFRKLWEDNNFPYLFL
jgi:hypothetical protein